MTTATTYDVYLDGRLLAQAITLTTAEDFCKLDPAEIEWAIGEHGVCTALDQSGGRELNIVAHGDALPISEAAHGAH
jgi:hypothetical protein